MKATGVVRKIDHLGRIVIPKEIRKSLKIKDGENLEIFIENDVIFLKKSSSLNGIELYAQNLVDAITSLLGKSVFVTDLDKVIATSKDIKNLCDVELESNYLDILEKREVYVANDVAKLKILEKCVIDGYYLLLPIVISGELLGSIVLFSNTDTIKENDKFILKFVLKFLEKNLEE